MPTPAAGEGCRAADGRRAAEGGRNVVSACELDSARRRALIRTVPWYWRILLGRRLEQYAAVPGSKRFERFRNRKKIYFMTCMVRSL